MAINFEYKQAPREQLPPPMADQFELWKQERQQLEFGISATVYEIQQANGQREGLVNYISMIAAQAQQMGAWTPDRVQYWQQAQANLAQIESRLQFLGSQMHQLQLRLAQIPPPLPQQPPPLPQQPPPLPNQPPPFFGQPNLTPGAPPLPNQPPPLPQQPPPLPSQPDLYPGVPPLPQQPPPLPGQTELPAGVPPLPNQPPPLPNQPPPIPEQLAESSEPSQASEGFVELNMELPSDPDDAFYKLSDIANDAVREKDVHKLKAILEKFNSIKDSYVQHWKAQGVGEGELPFQGTVDELEAEIRKIEHPVLDHENMDPSEYRESAELAGVLADMEQFKSEHRERLNEMVSKMRFFEQSISGTSIAELSDEEINQAVALAEDYKKIQLGYRKNALPKMEEITKLMERDEPRGHQMIKAFGQVGMPVRDWSQDVKHFKTLQVVRYHRPGLAQELASINGEEINQSARCQEVFTRALRSFEGPETQRPLASEMAAQQFYDEISLYQPQLTDDALQEIAKMRDQKIAQGDAHAAKNYQLILELKNYKNRSNELGLLAFQQEQGKVPETVSDEGMDALGAEAVPEAKGETPGYEEAMSSQGEAIEEPPPAVQAETPAESAAEALSGAVQEEQPAGASIEVQEEGQGEEEIPTIPTTPSEMRRTLRLEYAPKRAEAPPAAEASPVASQVRIEAPLPPRKEGGILKIEPYTEKGTLRIEHAPKTEAPSITEEAPATLVEGTAQISEEVPLPERKKGGTLRMSEAASAEQEKGTQVTAEDIDGLIGMFEVPPVGSKDYLVKLANAVSGIREELRQTGFRGSEQSALALLDAQAIGKLNDFLRDLEGAVEGIDADMEKYEAIEDPQEKIDFQHKLLRKYNVPPSPFSPLEKLKDWRDTIVRRAGDLSLAVQAGKANRDYQQNPKEMDYFIEETKGILGTEKGRLPHERRVFINELGKMNPAIQERFQQEGLL